MYQRFRPSEPASRPSIAEQFGVRGVRQLARDIGTIFSHMAASGTAPVDPTVVGHFRPSIALPAYAGLKPVSGVAPIMNFFDRTGGGAVSTNRPNARRDWRGGRLTYDGCGTTSSALRARLLPLLLLHSWLYTRFASTRRPHRVRPRRGRRHAYTLTRVIASIGQPLVRGGAGVERNRGLIWSGFQGCRRCDFSWCGSTACLSIRIAQQEPSQREVASGNEPETS
jgi:hypothetical protein